nr:hypothetical protein WG33_0249 [uncultured bacterium]
MFEFRDNCLSQRSAAQLAARIALMLFGNETVLHQPSGSDDRYTIGRGNDYRLDVFPDGRYRFLIRYSTPEQITALQFMFTQYLAVVVLDTATTCEVAS